MPHYPINHRLSGTYRVLTVAVSLLMLVWAVIGVAQTSGQALFRDEGATVLGLRAGLGMFLLTGLAAGVVLVSMLLGRRRQHFLTEGAGAFVIVLGMAGLTLPSFLSVGVAGCIAAFLAGSFLLLAGMYTKPGTQAQARAEEVYRHSSYGRVAEPAKLISSPQTKSGEVND